MRKKILMIMLLLPNVVLGNSAKTDTKSEGCDKKKAALQSLGSNTVNNECGSFIGNNGVSYFKFAVGEGGTKCLRVSSREAFLTSVQEMIDACGKSAPNVTYTQISVSDSERQKYFREKPESQK